jgi:hypothetical protein
MDYPRRQAIVEPAAAPASGSAPPDAASPPADWEIPLWTFSQACLAQGRLASGDFARTLIDTANFHGTYASTEWASRRLPEVQPLKRWFMQRYQLGRYTISGWELGDLPLTNWPVRGTLPPELERLDLIDLLVGRDLLARYRVEIDLSGRRMLLRTSE